MSPGYCNKVVPFLSPANDPWPVSIYKIQDCCFANLNRTAAREKIDLSITCNTTEEEPIQPFGISGEFNNDTTMLELEVLRDILTGVPMTSWLHIVYCTQLQDRYWTKDARVDFRDANHLADLCLLRVSITWNLSLQLQPLFPDALPRSRVDYKRLVIFYPLEELWLA
jgi:hypothetical protein